MKKLITFATLAATPAFAHPASSGFHMPHTEVLALAVLAAVAGLIYARR